MSPWRILAVLAAVVVLAADARTDSVLVFNEIQYHPAADSAEPEWVELHNQLGVDLDISRWRLEGGVRFEFQEGTVVLARGYIVVAADPDALELARGISGVLGSFEGRLDNGGDGLDLLNGDGRLLDHVEYDDEGAWPCPADGSGSTLAKVAPDTSSAPARNWTWSIQRGGSPGAINFPSEGVSSLPADIVSYWNLDQATGTLTDLVGQNSGTLGSGAFRVDGMVGAGAVRFDNSVGAYISVGSGVGDNFAVTEGISVEALILPTWSGAAGDSDAIFRKEDGPNRISFGFEHDGTTDNRDVPIEPASQPVLSFGINVGGVYGELDMPLDGIGGRPTFASLVDGQVHHVAATYDSATGKKTIYVDGVAAFSSNLAPGAEVQSGGATTAYIGNMSGRGRPFTGRIDEVVIWKRALRVGEVAAHHAAARAGDTYFAEAESEGPLRLAFSEYSVSTFESSWLEIANLEDREVDLSGFRVVAEGTVSRVATLDGPVIPAGARGVLGDVALGFHLALGDKVFLLDPLGEIVLAGAYVRRNLEARADPVEAHPTTGRWWIPARPTPGEANVFPLHEDVVIHEIFYHAPVQRDGASVVEDEEAWIELYNRGASPVDLTGWSLDEAVEYRFEDGTILGAGEYLVLAGDRVALAAKHPGVRIVGDFTKRLSRRGDRVELEDPAGNTADEVNYNDGGRWSGLADGGGSSLELIDSRSDNSIPEAWAASDETSRTTWQAYSYQGVAATAVGPTRWNEFVLGLLDDGEVLIDDLSVLESPSGAAKEIIRNGSFETGATSWRFLGNHRHSEVIDDPDSPGNKVLRLVALGSTEHMHNHLETTLVGNAAIVNGREYRVSFRARWRSGSPQLHTRLYFNRLSRTTILSTPDLHGTPGRANTRRAANVGPLFAELVHDPVVPSPGEDTRVRVTIRDPDPVPSATLWWNVGGGTWNSAPLALGADGVHEALVPGQASGALVQFYVEAVDSRGASSTFPPRGRDSRAHWKVADGQGPTGGTHTLRILLPAADTSFLHSSVNVMSNEWLPCTVVYDERQCWYDAGVRLKGSERGRDDSGRVGFHLRFPPDAPFRGVHKTLHIDRSGGWVFGGPSGQDEILIKHLVNHAGGIPGMHDDIVRVIAPRSSQNGPALLLMAAFGDVYLDGQWEDGSEGTSHKLELIYYPQTTLGGGAEGLKLPQPDDVIGSDVTNLGNDKEAYRWTLLIENNVDRDDFSGVIALSKAFSSSVAQLGPATEAIMDVDEWMRAFAVYSLCGVTDTYTQGNNHNNVYYRRPTDGRMLVFPWDMDFAWVRPVNSALWGDQNLSRVIQLPQNLRRFYGHLIDLTTTTFHSGYATRWANHYASIAGENYTTLVSYLNQRKSFVLASLPARVSFAITTSGGADFSVAATEVVLEGTAWFDVREIYLVGAEGPLEFVWSTTTRWRTTLPLDAGENRLELVALDYAGDLFASDVIRVTSTVGTPAPALTSALPSRAYPGDIVRFQGTGLLAGSTVHFDGTASPRVWVDTAAQPRWIDAEVPSGVGGYLSVHAQNPDGRESEPFEFLVLGSAAFIRGDANRDERVDLGDAQAILFYLYGGRVLSCGIAADIDDDGAIRLDDAIRLLNHLFQGGPSPAAPYPFAGLDPGPRGLLDCEPQR